MSGRYPCADDPDALVFISVSHDQQLAPRGHSHRDEAYLEFGMPWIEDRAGQCIAEHGARLLERDPMLPKVSDLLLRVPFKPHPWSIRALDRLVYPLTMKRGHGSRGEGRC